MALVIVFLVVLIIAGLIVAGVVSAGRRAQQGAMPPSNGAPGGRRQSRALVGYGAGKLGTWIGLFVVPANHVGIVRKRFGPAPVDRRFKMITPSRARGTQARTLLPGRSYWLTPGVHSVEFVRRVDIPPGTIGVVTATDGAKRPPGRSLGRHVDCDDYQDGEAFLLNGGEQGRQLTILRGDASYYLNTELFKVDIRPRTHVEAGTIGLVIAKDGAIRPPDRPFGRYVECDNFQLGEAFLRGGGEQGRQLAILTGGTYDINPHLFDVITTQNLGASHQDGLRPAHLQEIRIDVGYVGVVVTLDGAEPERGERRVGPLIKGHGNFRLPWVFLAGGGWRGVQEETLGEGSVYALNPWFVRVVLIPTRLLILEWTKKDNSQANDYDAALDRISVNVQGHRLQVELSQTLNIPESAAPRLVSEFGDSSAGRVGGLVDNPAPVQRFVERVLGAAVDTYFSGIAAESSVEEFFNRYASIRTDVAAQVRNALAAWGVQAATTNLGEFESLDPELDKARSKVALAQIRAQELEVEELNAHRHAKIRQTELGVAADERRLELVVLEGKIKLLGQSPMAMKELLMELKHMGVPQVVSGDAESMLKWLPMQRAMELVDGAMQRAGQGALTQPGPDGTPDALTKAEQETDKGAGQGTASDQGAGQGGGGTA